MNEHIQELIEQATIRGVEYVAGNNGHPTPTFYFSKEKFAELIQQDVLQHLTNTGQDHAREILERYFAQR